LLPHERHRRPSGNIFRSVWAVVAVFGGDICLPHSRQTANATARAMAFSLLFSATVRMRSGLAQRLQRGSLPCCLARSPATRDTGLPHSRHSVNCLRHLSQCRRVPPLGLLVAAK
jgi:hypothetical protein